MNGQDSGPARDDEMENNDVASEDFDDAKRRQWVKWVKDAATISARFAGDSEGEHAAMAMVQLDAARRLAYTGVEPEKLPPLTGKQPGWRRRKVVPSTKVPAPGEGVGLKKHMPS